MVFAIISWRSSVFENIAKWPRQRTPMIQRVTIVLTQEKYCLNRKGNTTHVALVMARKQVNNVDIWQKLSPVIPMMSCRDLKSRSEEVITLSL